MTSVGSQARVNRACGRFRATEAVDSWNDFLTPSGHPRAPLGSYRRLIQARVIAGILMVGGRRILMEHPHRLDGDRARQRSLPVPRLTTPPPVELPCDDPGRQANTHTARGVALAGRRQYREAIEEFREAVRLVPDNAIARSNLGMTLGRAGALEGDEGTLAEAVEQQRMAIQLQPGTVGLYLALAAVLAIADRVRDAMAVLDEALQLDPSNARTRALRSVAQLTLGDFETGWLDFDSRLDDPTHRALEFPGVPRWRGETLRGPLLINGPADGQGDCIQGIRFATEARRRVGTSIMLCLPSMARLMSRCDGVDRVVTTREELPAVEAQIAPLYLASVFRPKPATIEGNAYLSADPATLERWRPAIKTVPGLKVGISWQGNADHHLDACRSFRLAEFEPLARIPGVTLVSLQKGQGVEQLEEASFPVIDLGPGYAAGDWLETAAVVSHLDLLIAPDTAIAHLAGALARPTWLALARPAEWRWMEDRTDSPWYPTMRLFRQDRLGVWGPVFRRMAAALDELAGGA